MITQETKPVKTWGGFDLAILKVNFELLVVFCHEFPNGEFVRF